MNPVLYNLRLVFFCFRVLISSNMAVPLKEFAGKVVELSPKHKAIVEFQLDNKTERALLWYDKLRVDGEPVPQDGSIDTYLKMNTVVKFMCHTFDETGIDK